MTHPSEDTHHLTELEVAAYLDRAFHGADLDRVERHIAHCADCREKIVGTEDVLARSRRPRRWIAGAALAAAAAVMIIVVPAAQHNLRRDPILVRDMAPKGFIGAQGPVGSVNQSSLHFSWSRVPSVVDYRVKIFLPDGTVAWSASTTDTAIALPSNVQLQSNQLYAWTIEAELESGETQSSGLSTFTLR